MINYLQSDQWATPLDLFIKLDTKFGFQFDLCANNNNTKCDIFTSDIKSFIDNGHYKEFDKFWINPPYSRGNIDMCMDIVHRLAVEGKTIVSLTRFDPTTDWFKHHVDGVASEVLMLARRVKFEGAKDSYNFPCCISIYRGAIIRLVKDKYGSDYRLKTDYSVWDWKSGDTLP